MTELSSIKASARRTAETLRDTCSKSSAGMGRVVSAHALLELGRIPPSGWVACYLAIRSEMDATPLMLALHGLGYNVCIPVVDDAGKPLLFRQWTPDATLERGAFGVKVPTAGEWVEPELMFVPLLAFDAQCYRLGYGGGYYDRTIAAIRGKSGARAIGLAYSRQLVQDVPRDSTDVQLDAVVTETGVLRPRT